MYTIMYNLVLFDYMLCFMFSTSVYYSVGQEKYLIVVFFSHFLWFMPIRIRWKSNSRHQIIQSFVAFISIVIWCIVFNGLYKRLDRSSVMSSPAYNDYQNFKEKSKLMFLCLNLKYGLQVFSFCVVKKNTAPLHVYQVVYIHKNDLVYFKIKILIHM